MFLEISKNSKENTCARTSLLIKFRPNKVAVLKHTALLKKGLWHRSFPVNFEKFPRTPFLVEHLCWLLLGSFLGCQSMWYFSRNTIISRINNIFLGDAGNITLRCTFLGQGHLFFFAGGQCDACNTYMWIQKIP